MSNIVHFPRLTPEKMNLLEERSEQGVFSLAPPRTMPQNGSGTTSRVKSETPRYHPPSDLLSEEERQSAKKKRRKSFPPLPPPSQHHGATSNTHDASFRPSISEVVARMRVRERTLLGEALTTKKKTSDGGGGGSSVVINDTPAYGFVPVTRKGGINEQTQIPPLVVRKSSDWESFRVRTIRRRFLPHHNAWSTSTDPPHRTLQIHGTPVFSSNSVPWPASKGLITHNGIHQHQHQQQNGTSDGVDGSELGYSDDDFDESEEEDIDSDHEEFDFDQGEDEVEARRLAGRQCLTTSSVYQRACQRLRVQPAPAFLRQVNLTTMDLRDVGLGSADVKPIAIALVRDIHVYFLDLSNNDLGCMGVSYIAEMLQENRTIYDLNLSNTRPGREGLKALLETLPLNPTLLYLRLEDNDIEHTEGHLLAHIITTVPNLQGLYLGHNKLGYRGGAAIATAIAQNSNLHTLDLQWNHIRRDSGVALVRALAKNSRLRQLNLAWNGLGKEGCLALAHALPCNTSLRELDLTCNRVDLLSLGFLLRGLAANSCLRSLKIGQNPITTEGAKALLETISSSDDVALTEIDITGVPVDLEFSQMLSRTKKTRLLHVKHEEALTLATSDRTREHDGTNLDRYDPVMVLFEYMKMDNLRVIDMFQYMDVKKRDKLSKGNIRDGLNTLRLPVTEHAIDVIVQKLDLNKDGFVELDEMMKVQRDTARQVKLRQIKAKAKNREDESLNGLHKILREVISKRTEDNETRRDSQQQGLSTGSTRRTSISSTTTSSSGGRRKSSVGGLQLTQARYSVTSVRPSKEQHLETIPDE